MSTTCAASRGARRSSCRAPIRSSWPKLFAKEVPEVYDGIVEIKSVARDPGSRAKIAVVSRDASIDPVGACVGMRGSRVQAVVGELQGEKIDIIQWSPSAATFIVNALAPAEVVKVVLDEDAERIEVVVPDDQLSLAIGRKRPECAARLAAHRLGHRHPDRGRSPSAARPEFAERSSIFMEALDVDEVIAQLLASEGFSSVEEVAFVEPSEIASIEGSMRTPRRRFKPAPRASGEDRGRTGR